MEPTELFTRHPANPIIRATDIPIPCKAVCNPAATVIDGDVVLLLRVIDPQDRSHLLAARSADGFSDWRYDPEPLLGPDADPLWYETGGCEDPRVVYLAERGEYAITYVGNSRFGASVCLATTRDFQTVSRQGVIFPPYDKDAALFPRRVGGRYLLLHRPTAGPLENIWLAGSDTLKDWGDPYCVLEERDQPGWDSGKVGTGPPPIETEQGWLLIFHGVQKMDAGWVYRVGLALLGTCRKALEASSLAPRNGYSGRMPPYEMQAPHPGIVFPTGTVVKDGIVSLYYGAADDCVALATAPLAALLDSLRNDPSDCQDLT